MRALEAFPVRIVVDGMFDFASVFEKLELFQEHYWCDGYETNYGVRAMFFYVRFQGFQFMYYVVRCGCGWGDFIASTSVDFTCGVVNSCSNLD